MLTKLKGEEVVQTDPLLSSVLGSVLMVLQPLWGCGSS